MGARAATADDRRDRRAHAEPAGDPSTRPLSGTCARLVVITALILAVAATASAQNIVLSTATGGVAIGGSNPDWTASLGNVNGLGVGTPSAGVTLITSGVTGGVLYTTPVNVVVSGAAVTAGHVMAHVSTAFSAPSALQLRVCSFPKACTTAADFLTVSSNAATPTEFLSPQTNGTYVSRFGLFVANLSGAGAFSGAASATMTLRTYRGTTLRDTDTLAVSATAQTAVRLLLATAAGGRTISAGSGTDFSIGFGDVNGLGINPGANLTVTLPGGGALYATPYSVQPSFSGFSSAAASIRAHVSADFSSPSAIELRDSSDGITFASISKLPGAPTTLTTGASPGVPFTRQLGLFVAALNGPGAFTGAASAIVTYTLLVP